MVVLLDAYSLGDPLFVNAFSRDVRARGAGLVAVHASGEAGERALEGLGGWPQAADGVWQVGSETEAAAIERATRETNRRWVHALNEEGVPVIGLVGAGRGLLRRAGDRLEAGATDWLAALVRGGATAVVAALVADASRTDPSSTLGATLQEVDAARAAAALAEALGTFVAVFATGRAPRLDGPDGPAEALPVDQACASGRLTDAEAVRRAVAAGARVRAVTPAALRTGGLPEGTWVGLD